MTVGVRNFPRQTLDSLERAIRAVKALRGQPDGFVGTDFDGFATLTHLASGVPTSTKYLRGDGTWAIGASLADGDYGDIEVSGTGGTLTVEEVAGTIYLQNTATTAEIQAALNSLTTGGVVHLEQGDYTLTSTLYLSHPGLTLRGSGKGITTLYYTADRNTDIIVMEHYYCSVEDLTVSGTNPSLVNGSGAAGTGRGIVIAQPDTGSNFANPAYVASTGPSDQCTFPTIKRVTVTNTGSWCIYDSGLKTFTTAGNNWTSPLADTGFAISVLLTLEDVDVSFWASNGGIFVGGGSAAPHLRRIKTNGYTYNTYTQVSGVGAVPKNDMGGVFFYNSYGAEILDCYFQSPVPGALLPETDACLLSFLNSHSMAVVNPKFEQLQSGLTNPDSNGGAGGRQYYFITACNSSTLSVIDADFQTILDDATLGNSTLSNWGAKIFRSSDAPSAVGISFVRGVCFQGRTVIGAASGAKDTGDPVTWDRNDFVFAGNLDGDSTASTISIDNFVIHNGTTGKIREVSIPYNATISVANCTTAGVPSTTLTTTTGTFGYSGTDPNRAINRGDSVTDGITTTRVQYVTSTTTLVTEDALTVAPLTTIVFTPAGMNIAFKPNFKLRQKRSDRVPTWSTCDLTGAGDKNDFYARTILSQPLYGGVLGYVASGDLDEGLWLTNSNDNQPRSIPMYRRRTSFWSSPKDGDLNYLTSNDSLHTYSDAGAEWKQVFSLLRLSTAAGDLPYYSATSTPARLAHVGSANRVLRTTGASTFGWGQVDLTADVTGDLPYANLTPSANASRLLGRTSASAGDWAEMSVGSGLAIAGTVLDTALTLASGTYTPTLTGVANVAASTAYQCQYMRVGSVVTVSGKVDVDPTAPAAATQLGISLPVASNLGAAEDCAGTAFAPAIAGQGAAILGDAANNRAEMNWVSADITNQPMYFTFTYEII